MLFDPLMLVAPCTCIIPWRRWTDVTALWFGRMSRMRPEYLPTTSSVKTLLAMYTRAPHTLYTFLKKVSQCMMSNQQEHHPYQNIRFSWSFRYLFDALITWRSKQRQSATLEHWNIGTLEHINKDVPLNRRYKKPRSFTPRTASKLQFMNVSEREVPD